MQTLIRRLVTTLLLALVPALFCALMSAPLSFALPLNCPEGSKVIGIECFDGQYANTTPWYRLDMNLSFVSFPVWLVLALGVAWFVSAPRPPSAAAASDVDPDQLAAELEAQKPTRVATTGATKADPDADKRWLPTQCPQCGGALAINDVQWISSFEARCPFCGSVLKA